jgi:hypothetical protein
MKKVRYLAGAVAAVVPAIGLVLPVPAASAAPAAPAHPARPGAKTVSLRHAAAARIDAAAAGVSSTAVSQSVSPGVGTCSGHTEVHLNAAALSTKFWYTNETGSLVCIGTVDGKLYGGGHNPQQELRVRIYSGSGKHKRMAYGAKVGGHIHGYTSITAQQVLHRKFGYSEGHPIEVCTAWIDVGGLVDQTSSLIAGPQCRSVN